MQPETEPCRPIEWDAEFWGLPVAQVEGDTLAEGTLDRIDRWCADREIACLYFLARSDDPVTIRLAEAGGFRSVDIRVTLCLQDPEPVDLSGLSGLRQTRESDRAGIAELARTSYRFTRFYNDENFPDERCDDLYETWMLGCLDGLADAVLVVERDARLLGYITAHLDSEAAGRLGLMAVAPTERGGGLGRALILGALDWLQRHGAEHVVGITQGRNWVTQRMLQRAGFVTEKTEIWYHKWYR